MKTQLFFLLFIIALPTPAQIATDGTLGPAQNLPGPDYQIGPNLGQQHRGNLFHSFQDFNLNSAESATFSGPNHIQNVISRVTGGNPSNIDEQFRSTIEGADVYFLNPYGIMFGPNARLDVQGSFHASTAHYLRLSDGGRFDAQNPNRSARLDVFKKGGDSLMGRYFNYRLHPFSVPELTDSNWEMDKLIQPPQNLEDEAYSHLFQFGGFPEPFLKASSHFYHRRVRLRQQQLVREEIRDVARIQEIAQLEMLVVLLAKQAGQVTTYTTLAKQLRVSVDTVRRWLDVLEGFYYCYRIRPWHQNITTALRKEPKTYLWDWSSISDAGAKAENFIASHLLKAVQAWTDIGLFVRHLS